MGWDELRTFLKDAIKISNDIGIKYKQLKTIELCGSMLDQIYKNVCVELNNLLLEEEKLYESRQFDENDYKSLLSILKYEYNFDITSKIENMLHNVQTFNGVARTFF